jgi:hypothetical protein
MRPEDVFGIIVRTIGLLLMLSWLIIIWMAVASGSAFALLIAFVICTLGGYLLRGAPHVVAFAYPPQAMDRAVGSSSNEPMQTDPPSAGR